MGDILGYVLINLLIGMTKKIISWLNIKGEKISESDLIVFDYRVLLLVIFSFIIFVLLVLFKVNYSSIGSIENVLGKTNDENGIIFGQPKGIRSDEWGVITPFMLSQASQVPSFPSSNESLGYGKTPLLMSLPVWHYTSFFRPQNWGFLFLNFDQGFSFYWNFKVFGLFLSFFFLLLLFTKNNFWLSISGSIWLLFSGFVQWWFSSGAMLPETITCFSVILLSTIYVVYAKKKVSIYLNMLLIVVFGINFALFLYPPFQIPLIYLIIFLLIGYVIKTSNPKNIRLLLKRRMFLLAIVLFAIIAVLSYFYLDVKDTIKVLENTVYPGNRIVTGGGLPFTQIFSGYYSMFFTEKVFPLQYGNVCEASNFILFFPFLILYYAFKYIKTKRIDPIILALISYLILITLWVEFSFPVWVGKYSFLGMVPGNRALVGIGVGSIILTIIFLSDRYEEKLMQKDNFFVLILGYCLVFIGMILFSFKLNIDTSGFFSVTEIVLISALISLLVCLLIKRKSFYFFLLLLPMIIIPGFPINPINKGLGDIENRPLVNVASEINIKNNNAEWLVFGSHWQASVLQSSGINIINGVKFIPELVKMRILDPNLSYSYVYDRYAHIEFDPIADLTEIKFVLNQADFYTISINPCNDKLKQLNIDYVILPDSISYHDLDCLKKLSTSTVEQMNIFEYKK
jgi:hypothetical protein